MNYYRVFGLTCKSEIELPAFVEIPEISGVDFEVKIAKEIPPFSKPILVTEDWFEYNESEFYLYMEDVAHYFVRNGDEIFIQPIDKDWKNTLLYFYSNCIGTLLFQRNLIPFHVSGVIDHDEKVWLFAAPSQTGKSTLAVKLKELGLRIFTDDTALIQVIDGKCCAVPSYPMIRAWKNTLENQKVFSKEKAGQLAPGFEKYGILIHDLFNDQPLDVKGIVFLEEKGDSISIEKIGQIEGLQNLGQNVYRGFWLAGMKKQVLQYHLLTSIAQKVNFWKATRPESQNTFDSFAKTILEQLILG